MPTKVHAAASIELPIEACWQSLRDLTRATSYVPGVVKTVVTTDRKEGVGASRVVTHRQFGEMNETVIAWDEGEGFTIRLHKGDAPPRPFKEAIFRYELRPASSSSSTASPSSTASRCEIHTSLTYELPFGVLGRMIDALFMHRIFRRNVIDTAVSLAEHYRTGEPVPESALPRLRENAL